jgi:predicted component of type VI protein secretion system
MNFPSRRERRSMAKAMGLTKKKENLVQMSERFKRSNEFGKMIHLQHLQNLENSRINSEKIEEDAQEAPTNSPDWGLEDFKQQIISGENPE